MIVFQQTFAEAPVFLAELQELGTGNVLVVRWDYTSAGRVEGSLISSGAATTEMVRRGLQGGHIAVKGTLFV
jgi:hypothetical protein